MSKELAVQLFFFFYLGLIVAGGLTAVLAANLVRALLGLILAFFGTAGMFLLMNAPFMALMQILIYAGAVAVLVFFAVMMTKQAGVAEEGKPRVGALLVMSVVAAVFPTWTLVHMLTGSPLPSAKIAAEVPLSRIGQALLNEYVLAFELISIVLFVAMAGAVVLGFEKRESAQ